MAIKRRKETPYERALRKVRERKEKNRKSILLWQLISKKGRQ